jgi:hypothetical protein
MRMSKKIQMIVAIPAGESHCERVFSLVGRFCYEKEIKIRKSDGRHVDGVV